VAGFLLLTLVPSEAEKEQQSRSRPTGAATEGARGKELAEGDGIPLKSPAAMRLYVRVRNTDDDRDFPQPSPAPLPPVEDEFEFSGGAIAAAAREREHAQQRAGDAVDAWLAARIGRSQPTEEA
jgi:hypothetical protein